MRRIREAFREWLELRARVRDERRFHIERAAADLRALGLPARAAARAARTRFGGSGQSRIARRELGADYAGLVYLLRAYRVAASIWLQPVALLIAATLMVIVSPSPRLLIESLVGRPLHTERTIYFSAPAPWPLFSGITENEFHALRSLRSVQGLERYQTVYVRAQATRGVTSGMVEAEARALLRNPRLVAISAFERNRIELQPAIVMWIFAALCGLVFYGPYLRELGVRLLIYGLFVGLLNLLASLTAWGLVVQVWSMTPFSTRFPSGLAFSSLPVAYLLSIALQCRCLRRDLFQRCPVCLGRLLLASTEGAMERVLLRAAVTESVCAHGHGQLVETRWERRFRRGERDFGSLMSA